MTVVVACPRASLTAETATRTVSGLVLPWETPGQTSLGPLSFARGAISIPNDVSTVKLYSDHRGEPGHKPVGYALGWEAKGDGLHMSFRVAATPDGDAALADVTERVRDGFSVEVDGIRREGDTITGSLLGAVALVAKPAYASARVHSVRASHTPTSDEDTMPDMTDTTPAVPAEPATPPAQTPAEPAAPPAQDPAEPSPAPAPAAAVVPQGIGAPVAAAPAALSLAQAADALYAVQTGTAAPGELHAALADITGASMVEGTPPQWLGELYSGVVYTRRVVPLMGTKPLTSWRIQAFRWTDKPMVAQYAGNKTEIPTDTVAIEPFEAEAIRWAGGHDLDRKFWDFHDTSILDAYWRAMAESYARATDEYAAKFIASNATASGSAPDLLHGMAMASATIEDNLNASADYFLANPADRLGLLSVTTQSQPAYLGLLGIDPARVVWSRYVPAGTLIAGCRPAATFYELGGSPLRVEAEHLSHGGRDAALFGYTAVTLDNPGGLVKITVGGSTPAPATP